MVMGGSEQCPPALRLAPSPHVPFSPRDKWWPAQLVPPVILNGVCYSVAYSRTGPFLFMKAYIPLDRWTVILSFLLLDA